MQSLLENYSIAAAIIIGVGWLFTEFYRASNGKKSPNGTNKVINEINERVKELHTWHSVTDEDGVKIWYVRRSIEDAIRGLSANIAKQTVILERVINAVANIDRDVKDMKKQ